MSQSVLLYYLVLFDVACCWCFLSNDIHNGLGVLLGSSDGFCLRSLNSQEKDREIKEQHVLSLICVREKRIPTTTCTFAYLPTYLSLSQHGLRLHHFINNYSTLHHEVCNPRLHSSYQCFCFHFDSEQEHLCS